jgi:hypothetical protein
LYKKLGWSKKGKQKPKVDKGLKKAEKSAPSEERLEQQSVRS